MRRRLVFIVVSLFCLVVVVLATMPFWLGTAVRTFGSGRGVTFASYERVGYGRFALKDVEYKRDNVRVTASRAEAPTPLVWAWRHWRDGANPVVVDRWAVEIAKSRAPPKAATTERGWMPLQALLRK